MEKGEIWGPKGRDDMRGLLSVNSADESEVIAYPRFGGFALRIPLDEFTDRFERYSEERLSRMADAFERSSVTLDSDRDGLEIPCWTNGANWNGWEVPFFERKEFDAALGDGRVVSNEFSSVEFDDAAGSYVEIMPTDGGPLPKDLDRRSLVEQAVREGGGGEFALANGASAYVSVSPSRVIDTPDGRVTVYNVGDGWTWSRTADPETAAKP